MNKKIQTLKGFRDFSAKKMVIRNEIIKRLRSVFEKYGFDELQTPSLEYQEILLGKYGEEAEKLMYLFQDPGGRNVGLRYDLTVPLARFVGNNVDLPIPFKRYQIQPVWRADKPQKGRYREFYQCDVDVVGSNSLLNEVELTAIYATVFERLQLPVEIRINSRKILAGLAELCGGQELMVPITVAIDKLDKIGIEKVKEELLQRGINQDQILIIEKYLSIDGANDAKIEQLKQLMGNNPTAIKGIEELEYILAYHSTKYSSKIVVDFTLARGLNYYTGVIFEIKAIGAQMGSIGGGGRYDDLTGLFGVPNVPGVGISFGVDRIYDVLEELKLFPEAVEKGTKVLFFNLGNEESKTAFYLMQELRESGITAELYHEQSKFDKQFKYAEKKQVPYVVIIGSTELTEGTCIIKNIVNGEQKTISQQELVTQLF